MKNLKFLENVNNIILFLVFQDASFFKEINCIASFNKNEIIKTKNKIRYLLHSNLYLLMISLNF